MTKIFACLIICCLHGLLALAQSPQAGWAAADSAFMDRDYVRANHLYRQLMSDSSRDAVHLNRLAYTELARHDYLHAEIHLQRALDCHPSPAVKASLLSRLARIRAHQHRTTVALDLLDSAVVQGYMGYQEMDTLADFEGLRHVPRFTALRKQLFDSLYPCYNDSQARAFDFWIGEWDVYVTGTNTYAGHSLVQRVAGGCALLENWQSAVSEGKSLNFVDDSTHEWKQVWIGSYPNGKQDFVHGQYRDSAMHFTFTTVDSAHRPVAGRFTFFNQGPDQVRQINETSSDQGATWIISYDFTYRRIRSPKCSGDKP